MLLLHPRRDDLDHRPDYAGLRGACPSLEPAHDHDLAALLTTNPAREDGLKSPETVNAQSALVLT
jgi:hypothetical protein